MGASYLGGGVFAEGVAILVVGLIALGAGIVYGDLASEFTGAVVLIIGGIAGVFAIILKYDDT